MKSRTHKNTRSIVWAIDPFETKNAHRAPLAKAIRVLSKGLSEEVIPYSLVYPPSLLEYGTRNVARDLKKLRMKSIKSPAVEAQDFFSKRELVREVMHFAKTHKAEFIGVNTQRLLSPFPFRVGGFAEALIGKSKTPVLAVSPKAKISPKIKTILFPSDFSNASHIAFRKTLAIASKLHAKIILLYVDVAIPSLYPTFQESISWEITEARKAANAKNSIRWCTYAKKLGVDCVYQTISNADSIASGVLHCTHKNKADLICIGNHRGLKPISLLGSTMRDVLGSAKKPVLEIHTH